MKRVVSIRKITDRHAEGPDRYPLTLTPAERLELAWRLSLEAWSLAHPGEAREPRLQKSFVRLYRR